MAVKLNEARKQQGKLTFLLVGQAGAGKSYMASTFPKPMYLWAFDKDLTTYAKAEDSDQILVSELSLETDVKLDFVNRLYKELDEALKPEIRTVVLDSLTRLSEYIMSYLLKRYPAPENKPEYHIHYNALSVHLKQFLEKLTRDKTKYIVLLGHQDQVEDKGTGAMTITLSASGKNKVFIPTLADEYYFLLNRKIITYPPRLNMSGRSRIGVPSNTDNTFQALLPYLKKLGIEEE